MEIIERIAVLETKVNKINTELTQTIWLYGLTLGCLTVMVMVF